MNDLENKLRGLKLKKALLLSELESLSEIDDSAFVRFGKIEFEIIKLEKELVRTVKNDFED